MAGVIEGIRGKIKAYLKERDYRNWCRRDGWRGLVPGDVVEYKGNEYMYMGINRNGGPGMPGMPEPFFWYADPRKDGVIYLRPSSAMFPEEVFSEKNAPVMAGGIASITDLATGETVPGNSTVGYISFLNTDGSDLKKVKHISPQEWKSMVDGVKAELGGATVH